MIYGISVKNCPGILLFEIIFDTLKLDKYQIINMPIQYKLSYNVYYTYCSKLSEDHCVGRDEALSQVGKEDE